MKKTLQKRFTLKTSRGFTLMELLIVMVILGILTTIVAGSFSSSQEKARDTRRKNDLQSISKALEAYYNDKGQYPPGPSGNIDTYAWGEELSDANGTVYMTKIPEEKTASRNYFYYSDGQYVDYALYAQLENELDKDIPVNASNDPQVYGTLNCGGGPGTCNYAISSSNTNPEDMLNAGLTP